MLAKLVQFILLMHKKVGTRVRLRRTLLELCLLAAICAHSAIASASLNESIYLDVSPSTSLEDALIDWGSKARVAVMINSRVVEGQRAPEIHGQFQARAALVVLLVNSGLAFKEDVDGVKIISLPLLRPSALRDLSVGPTVGVDTSSDIQAAPDDSLSSHSGSHQPELQEVIVSAQRRDEDLQTVPISITALSQSTLDDFHLQSISDLATIVPGLVVPPGGAGSQSSQNIIIRGIVSGDNMPTTGVYIDDTAIDVRQNSAIAFSGTPQPDLFDLERVEVLRGPQGTLFGAGAMGGAIRFITPQPSLETASGYSKAEISYTEHGQPSYGVGVAYGAPITQGTSGFRVSVWYHSDGGFIDIEDPYTGQVVNRDANALHSLVLRPAFTFAPVDSLTITPAVYIERYFSEEPPEYWLNGLPNPVNGGFATGFGAHVHQPFQDALTVSSLVVKYHTSGVSIESDTSYTDRRMKSFDDYSNIMPALFGAPSITPALANFYSYDEDIARTTAWQQEFRASSLDSEARVSWLAGLYLRQAVDTVTQYITPDLTPVTELVSGQTSDEYFNAPNYVLNGVTYNGYGVSQAMTEQEALFGEVGFKILPSLKVSAGVRIEKSALTDQNEINAGALSGGPYTAMSLPNDVEHPITPKFGITYQYTESDMLYATVAKGYRTGGSNSLVTVDNPECDKSTQLLGLTSVPSTFKSDSLWSYEIGNKGYLFDRRLSVDASVFYIDWSKIQTSVFLPSCNTSFNTNFGRAISQGFDLQLAAVLTEHLKFSANGGYTNTYYPNASYGLSSPDGTPGPLLNGAGDKLTQVIPWEASAALEYTTSIEPLWHGAQSYARLDYRWLDDKPKANPNIAGYDPEIGPFPDQAYSLLNLRVGAVAGGLDLSVFGDNLTRSNPIISRAHVTGDPLFYANAIRPLTFGLTALYRF